MSFTPHTPTDIEEMLNTLGVKTIEDLFDEIPSDLKIKGLNHIPDAVSEMELARLLREKAAQDQAGLCFIGAGAYEHHIPSATLDLLSRGEFLTAYTPYQAEASQGTLQIIYEYQTMMTQLTGMDVSNASLYDGASALAEAVLMSIRASKQPKSRRILMPRTIHPHYRQTVQSIVESQKIDLVEIPFDAQTGKTDFKALEKLAADEFVALVVPMPNFFGVIEDVDALTNFAKQRGALVIALVNPTALALFKEPRAWGEQGADIVCGEGQALGVPMASGGPYFGFMCCRKEYVRQMPGRIVGRTVDLDGKPGFALTLQAREQHIRRSKATSNICTNQGLLVVAATIYMSLLGAEGLHRVAAASHENTVVLMELLSKVAGAKLAFKQTVFHEFVLQLNQPAEQVLNALQMMGIQGGFDLSHDYPELGQAILVCATETKTKNDLVAYQNALQKILSGEFDAAQGGQAWQLKKSEQVV